MRSGRKALVALALVAASVLSTAQAAEPVISGRARALDGGIIVIGVRRLAIDGVSAPPIKRICQEWHGRAQAPYPCGTHALVFLSSLIAGQIVYCVRTGKKRKNIAPARCYAAGHDLGEALVQAGWATANTESRRYVAAQESARAAQRGMWAGSFQPERKKKPSGIGLKLR